MFFSVSFCICLHIYCSFVSFFYVCVRTFFFILFGVFCPNSFACLCVSMGLSVYTSECPCVCVYRCLLMFCLLCVSLCLCVSPTQHKNKRTQLKTRTRKHTNTHPVIHKHIYTTAEKHTPKKKKGKKQKGNVGGVIHNYTRAADTLSR